jgi:hypothetical protein
MLMKTVDAIEMVNNAHDELDIDKAARGLHNRDNVREHCVRYLPALLLAVKDLLRMPIEGSIGDHMRIGMIRRMVDQAKEIDVL